MSSHRLFKGKLAIVTGSSRSLGAVLARHLAAKGANIIVNYTSDNSTEKAQEVVEELRSKYGVKAASAQADLATIDGLKKLVEIAKSRFPNPEGKFQIDIINNAGVTNPKALEGLNAEAYDAAIPYLSTDRSGRIVDISCIGASVGLVYSTAYAGSKGALEAMTRVWARELAERATVNSVSVGCTAEMAHVVLPLLSNAPLYAVRQGIDSEEVVEAAKDLDGRPAAWMTGSCVSATGGGVMTRS
ncbi:short chain dehydrogenase [Macroventuria anomochaeta]|uniref:Short chain dehydrogenase n=1 Tax=Macroventuria anomochaeta TaxID=301207 RepID=A0ACB6RRE6_9PLEO|nr:short chain dehydrogenase [Macroventuria anomochaeta]KAF2623708.1 short chain dehydrogenase [Macroventuria anomochaeta]